MTLAGSASSSSLPGVDDIDIGSLFDDDSQNDAFKEVDIDDALLNFAFPEPPSLVQEPPASPMMEPPKPTPRRRSAMITRCSFGGFSPKMPQPLQDSVLKYNEELREENRKLSSLVDDLHGQIETLHLDIDSYKSLLLKNEKRHMDSMYLSRHVEEVFAIERNLFDGMNESRRQYHRWHAAYHQVSDLTRRLHRFLAGSGVDDSGDSEREVLDEPAFRKLLEKFDDTVTHLDKKEQENHVLQMKINELEESLSMYKSHQSLDDFKQHITGSVGQSNEQLNKVVTMLSELRVKPPKQPSTPSVFRRLFTMRPKLSRTLSIPAIPATVVEESETGVNDDFADTRSVNFG